MRQDRTGRVLSEDFATGEVDVPFDQGLDLSVAGPSGEFRAVTPMPSTPIDSNPAMELAPNLHVSPLSLSDDGLTDSPVFYTPLLRNLQVADDDGSDSTPRNPPVEVKHQPADQRVSGKARRQINMPADVVALPTSPLPMSGEVKSEPTTPTPEAICCEAMTVFVDDHPSGYLVKSPSGQVVVPNLTTGPTDRQPPSTHMPVFPGTLVSNQGAIRTRETRSKVAFRPYDKPTRSQSDPGEDERTVTRPKREIHMERGPNGRFRKKPQ